MLKHMNKKTLGCLLSAVIFCSIGIVVGVIMATDWIELQEFIAEIREEYGYDNPMFNSVIKEKTEAYQILVGERLMVMIPIFVIAGVFLIAGVYLIRNKRGSNPMPFP